jgi:hypothetical protein
MIKDVMVRVDGSAADEVRLAAANQIAEVFDGQITGLFSQCPAADDRPRRRRRRDSGSGTATHEARTADTFVALRPNGVGNLQSIPRTCSGC